MVKKYSRDLKVQVVTTKHMMERRLAFADLARDVTIAGDVAEAVVLLVVVDLLVQGAEGGDVEVGALVQHSHL